MKIRSEKKVQISAGKHIIPLLIKKNKQSKNYKLTFDKKNLRALISIPRYITFIEGIKFAEEHKNWLLNQLKEIYPINYISHGTKILFDDVIREVVFLENNEERVYATKKNIYVIDKKSAHSRRLKVWIKNELLDKVASIVTCLSSQLDVKTNNIKLSNSFSSWGYCNSNRDISINWRLAFSPNYVLKYIIAHELCHLREFNHGKNFWSLVESVCPEMQKAITWLKKNENNLYKLRFN
tara:strand:- start:36 stop:749 length:714 start_codon:yes stop_codon:yes gene_type:complete